MYAEFTQLPPIGIIQRRLRSFEGRSGLIVIGSVFG